MFIEILIILGLIILNGLFSMSEIAILSARKFKLENDAAKGNKKAQIAFNLADSPNEFLSTVQIGITLIGILTGVFSGAQITDDIAAFFNQFSFTQAYSRTLAVITVVFLITYFSLVLGELVPKRLGLNNAEGIAKGTAGMMRMLSRVAYPFIYLLSLSTTFLLKLMGIKERDEDKITEEEIKAMIQEGAKVGEIQQVEKQIIDRVIFMGDFKVSSLMVHRSDIVYIDLEDDFQVNKNKIIENLHSAYPICRGNMEVMVGIIHLKDLFGFPESPNNQVFEKRIRPVLTIPESVSIYKLLEDFRKTHIHYAFIQDEYGTLQGMITLNDILEALVIDSGSQASDNEDIVKRDDGSWLVEGSLPFFEFVKHFHIEYPDKFEDINFNTLGGFVLFHLQKIPKTGEKFTWLHYEFEVIDMDGNRVDKILLKKKSS